MQTAQTGDGQSMRSSDGAAGTTVITIGLTPPVIGGGLALGYLAIRRMQGGRRAADAPGQQGAGDEPLAAAGRAAGAASQGTGRMLGSAAEAAGGTIQTLGESAGGLIAAAGTAASSGGTRLRQTATAAVVAGGSRVRQVPRIARENPPMALGLGIGIGALLGLLLPASRKEQQLIRPATESLAQQVRSAAQDTVEKVQLVADEATTSIKESAAEVGLVPTGNASS